MAPSPERGRAPAGAPDATPADAGPVEEPPALPPSDTLEQLPDDFWAASSGRDEAPEAATDPPSRPPEPAATATATREPSAAAPSTAGPRAVAGEGIALLQRLFPGRVLAIDPHPGDTRATDGSDDPTQPTAEVESDEGPTETGLESR